MQHQVAIKANEGENGSDIKHEASICALTNAKDRLVFATWCEESHSLMVAKGIANNFQVCEDLLLSMMKGVTKPTFKAAADEHGCETVDKFDSCVLALAELLFSE